MTEVKVIKTKTQTITWHSVDELLPMGYLGKPVMRLGSGWWTTAYWDGKHWRGVVHKKKIKPPPTHWADINGL
jgi:hypothetical protein